MYDPIIVPDWTRRDFLKTSALAVGGLSMADLLAACGTSNTTSQEHVTLNVLLANHTPYYAMIKGGFESGNNATINFTREAFALLPAKLSTAFGSGAYTWDVVYLWRAWVEQFRKYLTPLDSLGPVGVSLRVESQATEVSSAKETIQGIGVRGESEHLEPRPCNHVD